MNTWNNWSFIYTWDPQGKLQFGIICKCGASNHLLICLVIQLGLFTCLFLIHPPQERAEEHVLSLSSFLSTKTHAHWWTLHTFVSSPVLKHKHTNSLTNKQLTSNLSIWNVQWFSVNCPPLNTICNWLTSKKWWLRP